MIRGWNLTVVVHNRVIASSTIIIFLVLDHRG